MASEASNLNLNHIYNEACEATLKRMPSDFLDLTVTSPPYDNVRSYNGFSFNLDVIIPELLRVTKPGGVVVWVVADQTKEYCESLTSFRHAIQFVDAGWRLPDTMIYEKHPRGLQMGKGKIYEQCFEYMFIFCKGDCGAKTLNRIKDRLNKCQGHKFKKNLPGRNRNGSPKKFKEKQGAYQAYGYRGNVWKYCTGSMHTSKDKIAFEHPALMPEALARDHILSWSNPGDLVYDPFMGAGTTAKMAMLTGRNFIGSELSREYCNIAQARLMMHGYRSEQPLVEMVLEALPQVKNVLLPKLNQGSLFEQNRVQTGEKRA